MVVGNKKRGEQMKKIICILTILSVSLSLVSCNISNNEVSSVEINQYYKMPETMGEKNVVFLSTNESGEYLTLKVNGTISDFTVFSIVWNENEMDFDKEDVIYEKEKIRNSFLVIETYLPEGIPSEMIMWKDSNGKEHEYLINDTNLD